MEEETSVLLPWWRQWEAAERCQEGEREGGEEKGRVGRQKAKHYYNVLQSIGHILKDCIWNKSEHDFPAVTHPHGCITTVESQWFTHNLQYSLILLLISRLSGHFCSSAKHQQRQEGEISHQKNEVFAVLIYWWDFLECSLRSDWGFNSIFQCTLRPYVQDSLVFGLESLENLLFCSEPFVFTWSKTFALALNFSGSRWPHPHDRMRAVAAACLAGEWSGWSMEGCSRGSGLRVCMWAAGLLRLQGGHDALAAALCGLRIQITGVRGATGRAEINGSTRDPFINQAVWHRAAAKRFSSGRARREREREKKLLQRDDVNIKQSCDEPWCRGWSSRRLNWITQSHQIGNYIHVTGHLPSSSPSPLPTLVVSWKAETLLLRLWACGTLHRR